MLPGRAGVAKSATSGLGKSEWEGPDPAFWCANGYSVVAVDPRGSFASEGDVQWMSPQEADDGYDVIEWIAAQPWCDGAVTMSGNSWLGAMQFKIAATRPPHLSAIAPWEGFVDILRDLAYVGGVPRWFRAEIITEMNAGRGRAEDLPAMMRKYPYLNDYWRAKITDVEAIDVPAYVVASWTNEVHTRGTLDAYQRLDRAKTWLRVHNTLEWPDLFEYEPDLLKFFDHVVKGKDNGWDQTPHVRLSILDPGGTDQVNRPEPEYPLVRVQPTPLYLNATTLGMLTESVAQAGSAEYDVPADSLVFEYTVDHDVELIGPMKLHLWAQLKGNVDADFFVYVRKADSDGNAYGIEIAPGNEVLGALGRLRATCRTLDEDKSTPLAPFPALENPTPVPFGRPFAVDIAIWPMGMVWHPGERLQVFLAGRSVSDHFPGDQATINAGAIMIHTGGQYDSHLLVPVATDHGI